MNQYIAIRPDRCIACGTCQAACSEEHRELGLQAEPRISVVMTREVSAAVTCHHCEDAPCLQVCPVNAIRHEDGAVLIDEQRCIGCRLCGVVCPFGAVYPSGTPVSGVAGTMVATPSFPAALDSLLRWEIGVYTRAVKCDLCKHDPDGPRCVEACLTQALTYVTERETRFETKQKQVFATTLNEAMGLEIAAMRRKR